MTDPLRSDRQPAGGDVPDRDRDARIEELLLAGLTHYFADQHELAINVWTRVLFIDRGHARARAYIERARGAIAERQRQGDELLHGGRLALDRGDADEARKLITAAVEHGASPDEALAVLARIDRLENAIGPRHPGTTRPPLSVGAAAGIVQARRPTWHWVLAGLSGILLGAAAIVAASRADLGIWLMGSAPAGAPHGLLSTSVPVPTAADVALTRGETLFARGRLHEALLALDAVPNGDPLRARADEITSAIQKQLLAAARGAEAGPEPTTRRP
jgi:tetratricopeptide (TPR) repeat protein